MKKLLLALTLSAFSFTASATIFKLPEDSIVCLDLISIQMLHKAIDHYSEQELQEVIEYIASKKLCHPSVEAIVRVIDVSNPFVQVEGVSVTGRVWVHFRELK